MLGARAQQRAAAGREPCCSSSSPSLPFLRRAAAAAPSRRRGARSLLARAVPDDDTASPSSPAAYPAVLGGQEMEEDEEEDRTAVQKFLYPEKEELPDDFEMPIWDHLEELRERVLVGALAAAAAIGTCFCYSKELVVFLEAPVADAGARGRAGPPHARPPPPPSAAAAVAAAAAVLAADAASRGAPLFFAALLLLTSPLTSRKHAAPTTTSKPMRRDRPPRRAGVRFLQLSPGEFFFTTFKVAGYAGLLLAAPTVLYEIISYVLPGLTRSERRFLAPVVFGSSALFYGGLLFSYEVLTPAALNFFVSYAEGAVESLWSIDQYFEFVLVLMLSTGLSFQVPVIQVMLGQLGIVTSEQMLSQWRYVIVGATVVAAVLTPSTDPFTQALLALPLIGLYMGGAFAVRLIESGRKTGAPA